MLLKIGVCKFLYLSCISVAYIFLAFSVFSDSNFLLIFFLKKINHIIIKIFVLKTHHRSNYTIHFSLKSIYFLQI